jgi:predicted GIY-YIG superfamily endonuclease
MATFCYVYVLTSKSNPTRHYTGFTTNLTQRIQSHNSGQVPHTSKLRPWRIETAIAFRSVKKARDFENYLKSHAGRAFASKHF